MKVSDLLGRTAKSVVLLITISTAIAAIVAALYWLAIRWDNPGFAQGAVTREIRYGGVPGTLTLGCDCPHYIVVGSKRTLTFGVRIKLVHPIALVQDDKSQIFHEELWLWPQGQDVDPTPTFIAPGPKLATDGEVSQTAQVSVAAKDANLSQVTFQLSTAPLGGGTWTGTVDYIDWPIESRLPFFSAARPFIYAVATFVTVLILFYWTNRRIRFRQEQEQRELEEAHREAARRPGEASPAWDAANINLQAYFKRNLQQVKHVFWVSVAVMVVGFGFVLAGVYLSFSDPKQVTSPAKVAAISGLITQFIGATFMVIYRSTMTQANQFVTVLDNINTVGMAVRVLDSIPDTAAEVKNNARQQLATLLLGARAKTDPQDKPKKE